MMAKARVRMLGEMGIVAAIFARAWRDTQARSKRRQQRAWEFLRDERTAEVLEGWGVDREYYRRMVEMPERSFGEWDAEVQERVQWLYYVEGISLTEIGMELFGSMNRDRWWKLKRMVGVE